MAFWLVAVALMVCIAQVAWQRYSANDVLANQPDDLKIARQLLDSWEGEGHVLAVAKAKIDHVLQRAPENYWALHELARYQVMDGVVGQHYVTAGGDPYWQGDFKRGALERAEATIRKAIQLNPRFAEGYVLLAHIQTQGFQLNDARASLRFADAIGTDDPWLQLNWAAVLSRQGDSAAAAAKARRVIQRGVTQPKASDAAFDFVLQDDLRTGRTEEAMTIYQLMIARHPGDYWRRLDYARYLSNMLDQNDQAIDQLRKIGENGAGEGKQVLAMALYRKWATLTVEGRQAEADGAFDEAHAIEPDLGRMMAFGAAMPASQNLARALMSSKHISIDSRLEDGSTALLIATNSRRIETVRSLLELGANPNVRDKNGWTPLLSAASEGDFDIALMLRAKGADIRATVGGRDAAEVALVNGHNALAAMLRGQQLPFDGLVPRTH